MQDILSRSWQSFRHHLLSIKVYVLVSYRKIFDMAKEGCDIREYMGLILYTIGKFWLVVRFALAGFAFTITYKTLGQSLSLFFTGRSETMTIEFENTWLFLAAQAFLWIMFFGSLIVITHGVYNFSQVLRGKKTFRTMDSTRYVPEVTFEHFRNEVRSKLTNINARLDNIEHTLSVLIGGTSHAETPSSTEITTTKIKPKKETKNAKT